MPRGAHRVTATAKALLARAYTRPGREGHFIDDTFYGRKIRVYLPPGYQAGASKRYPVIYMTDGQDQMADPHEHDPLRAGFWNADLAADAMHRHGKPAIVVAIWHGGVNRLNESSPWRFRLPASTQSAGGKGNEHLSYIADRLKPWVDSHFDTARGARSTTIGGSSMGGLFSLYAGLRRPEVFGNVIAMSPSLWVGRELDDTGARVGGGSHLLGAVRQAADVASLAATPAGRVAAKSLRLYIDSGDRSRPQDRAGSGDGHRDVAALKGLLEGRGFSHGAASNLYHWYHRGHAHDQRFWSKRLPTAFAFALADDQR